jgi:HELP motif
MEELVDGFEEFPEDKWVANIKKPTNVVIPPDNNIPPPDMNIKLDHCYGYRVK